MFVLTLVPESWQVTANWCAAQEAAAADAAEVAAAEVAAAEEAEPMTIGSVAPPLDVEHWVSDGDGQFKPVTDFKAGRVYIVEFWATWCGPCISSMPHLAETQTAYADKDVQLISISDEDLETVETFLKRKYTPRAPAKNTDADAKSDADADDESDADDDAPKTYAELTNVYCLTTDPDESVYEDYMLAAGQNGIPTCFLVGKTGLIEWIGHPMRMDEPLAAIVADTWDRDAYAEEFQKEQALDLRMTVIMRLIRQAKSEDALVEIDKAMTEFEGMGMAIARLSSIRGYVLILPIMNMLKDEKFEAAAEAVDTTLSEVDAPLRAAFLSQVADAQLSAGDHAGLVSVLTKLQTTDGVTLSAINNIAWSVYEAAEEDDAFPESAIRAALSASETMLKQNPDNGFLLDTAAHLAARSGELDQAIELQTAAVENIPESQRADLQEYLDELIEEKNAE